MKNCKLIIKRTFLGSLILLQVLFFPSASYAQTSTTTGTDPAPTQSTTSTTPEAAPEPISGATPEATQKDTSVTSSSTTQSQPATQPQPQTDSQATTSTPTPLAATSQSASPTTGTNDTKLTDNTTANTQTNTQAQANNTINSEAQSGDAAVIGTKRGSDATSGDALVMANLINLLQSYSNVLGNGQLTTFQKDINGDVSGDIYIDPGSLSSIQNNLLSSGNVQVDTSSQINNDVNLSATSGDATVAGNKRAGDATSGDAHAVANIMNLINSAVSAGSGFLGVVNIYGNLEGDILLPASTLETLLASNAIPIATISVPTDSSLNISNDNNTAINNNITTTAQSGNATVSGNKRAGDATSGNATTNITVLNLTGQEVIGANTLLVFVNVQGKWVGAIVNAPNSTSAALGGGIITNSVAQDNNVRVANNAQINNNVSVAAQSGNASVLNNRRAGNATSGNATASANIANISGSQFALSSWFGILFINVFGTWHGSFGIDTAMGNPALSAPTTDAAPPVFRFIPNNDGGGTNGKHTYRLAAIGHGGSNTGIPTYYTVSNNQPDNSSNIAETPVVLAASKNVGSKSTPLQVNPSHGPSWMFSMLSVLVGASLLAGERIVTHYRRR